MRQHLDAVSGDLLTRCGQRVVLDVSGDDVQPGARESFGQRQPDSTPRTRHDRDLTRGKFHGAILTSSPVIRRSGHASVSMTQKRLPSVSARTMKSCSPAG